MSTPTPRPERQRVMRQIVRACARRPRSAPELARLTGSSLDSVHVLLHRLRAYRWIRTIKPGTAAARHVTRAGMPAC